MSLPIFQIGGLASGLDTAAMIDALIEVEQIPVRQLEARQETYQEKDTAWQTVSTRFSAIRTALGAIDTQNDVNKLVTATSSNEAAVMATATGAATPGAISFTVDALAATHQVASDSDFAGASALVGAGDFTITIGTTDHVVSANATTTLSDLAQSINGLDAGVTASIISVDGTDSKLMITAEDSGVANTFSTSSTISSLATTSVVQQGADAQLTVGSGPGALTVTRATNTITDLMPGITIDVKQTTTSPVTVSVGRDIDAAVEKVSTLVSEINAALETLGTYTSYNADAQTGGVLVGDSTARSLMIDLRSAISGTVNESSPNYPIASSIGISLNRTGTFDFSESDLRAALEADFDEVMDLLLESGSSIDSRISFAGASAATVEGDYEVVITQAASGANALSDRYQKPNDDVTFQIIVGATTVDVSVLKNDKIETVIQAITDALDGAGVSEVTVSQVTQAPHDYIQLNHSSIGSAASFQVVGDPFGLAGTYTGTDVAGTIGGQTATGVGQLLTATAGDPDGLAIRVTATQAEVDGAGGSLSLGNVSYEQGLFGNLDEILDAAEGSGGRIDRARNLWKAQIDAAEDRIETLLDRIDRKEALLVKQFAALETAMSTLSSQAAWLAAQLGATAAAQSG